MSLQVWLPLNGTFKNQGLDIKYKMEQLTANEPFFLGGQIGSCCIVDGIQTAKGHFKNLENLTKWSFALWLYVFPDEDNITAWSDIINIGANYDGNTGGIRIEHTNVAGQSQIICNKSGTSGNSTNTYWSLGSLGDNANGKWAHIVVTNDGTTIKTYLNGSLFNSAAVSNIYPVGGLTGDITIGSTGAQGLLNDVRVYDHVLSTKEIKELAKGLFLHYTFNKGDYDSYTNFFPQPRTISSAKTTGWDSALHALSVNVLGWTNGYNSGVSSPTLGYHAHWKNIEGIPTMVFPKLNHLISGLSATRWLGICSSGNLNGNIGASTTYTISFEAMADSPGRIIYGGYYYAIDNASSRNFHDGSFYARDIPVGTWKKYSFTFTTKSTLTTNQASSVYFYGHDGSNGIAYLRNPQIEIGNVCHDYSPGANGQEMLVYDSSGYGYNATITGQIQSASSNVDTALSNNNNFEKKNYSASFNGSTYACYENILPVPENYTLALWLNKNSDGHIIDWRSPADETGLQPIYLGGSKIQYYSSETGGGEYFNYIFNNNTWYHIALVATENITSLYVNGVKQQDMSVLNMPGGAGVFHIGCRVSYANVPIMKIRDLRLYCTALNETDINQIYKNSFTIDKNNNVYARELREGGGI